MHKLCVFRIIGVPGDYSQPIHGNSHISVKDTCLAELFALHSCEWWMGKTQACHVPGRVLAQCLM